MAYTTIDKPDLYFNTVLYSGSASSQSITGVGFQPDFCWLKVRSNTANHVVVDSVRGANKIIYTAGTNAETTYTNSFNSFDSDGFTLGDNTENNWINVTGNTFVSWNWLADNTSGSSNTDGSITSTVSANTTSGFSIVSYTGNGTSGATVGHGLGSAPKMFIVRRRNSTGGWIVYHEAIGNTKILELHDSAASQVSSAAWNNTSPSSSTFTLGNYTSTNTNGGTYIAYCFAEKKGFSKFGSYTGNGSTDGTFVYTGFKPAFLLVKVTSTIADWQLSDNKRDPENAVDKVLQPNTSASEYSGAERFDFLSNGFKLKSTSGGFNGSGSSYIYMAFAENPFVTSTGIPTCAR